MEIFAGLLFAISTLLLILYFGENFTERMIFENRTRFLSDKLVPAAAIKKEAKDLNFQPTEQRVKRFFSFSVPPSFSLMIVSLVVWVVLAVGLFVVVKADANLKIVISIILFLLIYRWAGVIARKQRMEQIQKELPGVMDLLVICLEAGLGMNSAFLRVANEMEFSPLGKELRQVINEASAGIPMETALRNLALRNGIEDINVIVAAVVQAQKLGTPLAETFRVQGASLREKLKMRLREQIAKIPIKILFPLVFFIFPVLFIIILGPAFLAIIENLGDA